ncbi:MAG: hypothetical protein NXI28_13080, partial [bacterium]|nr:hypothetical protein [bacterium]
GKIFTDATEFLKRKFIIREDRDGKFAEQLFAETLDAPENAFPFKKLMNGYSKSIRHGSLALVAEVELEDELVLTHTDDALGTFWNNHLGIGLLPWKQSDRS